MPIKEAEVGQEIINSSDIMALSVPLWVFDIDHKRIVWANDAARILWHAETLDELYQRDLHADMSSSIEERLKQYQVAFENSNKEFRELWTLYPDNQPDTYHIHLRGHRLTDGRMGLLCEAVSKQKKLPEHMRSAEALNHIPVCISLFSMDGDALYNNPEALMVYGDAGISLKDMFVNESDCQSILSAVDKKGRAELTCEVATKHGSRWHEISARACRDAMNGEMAISLSGVDVSAIKEQEQRVSYLAHHDMLTELYNRNYVNLKFPIMIEKAVEAGDKLAMVMIDLDNFKTVNDTLGHFAGDQLLVQIAKRLHAIVGESGTMARLGGDEFVILLPYEMTSTLDVLCEILLKEVATDCIIGDHHVGCNASIGISLCPEHGNDLATLMRHADLALYEAKDCGRDTYCYFKPALQQAVLLKRTLEKDLHRAITNREFVLYYQPRVDCRTQQVLSAEALIRWNHPQQGIVAPGMFIDTLEETGLIHRVGDWLVEQAGTDQRLLASKGYDFPISINISPKQFNRPDFVDRLQSHLAKTNCPTKRIEIEITESMLMGEGFDAKAVLMDLRSCGFSIAVDDFGTGYSNLAYIQEYPISSLKVDRSFVQMIEDRSSVVNMILSLCRLVGIRAVAEGVETVDQLEWLRLNHCDEYQGYLFSRPIPMHELFQLLKDPPKIRVNDPLDATLASEVSWAS